MRACMLMRARASLSHQHDVAKAEAFHLTPIDRSGEAEASETATMQDAASLTRAIQLDATASAAPGSTNRQTIETAFTWPRETCAKR